IIGRQHLVMAFPDRESFLNGLNFERHTESDILRSFFPVMPFKARSKPFKWIYIVQKEFNRYLNAFLPYLIATSLDLHRTQVLGQGADHQLLGLVIWKEIDAQKVLGVVAHLEVPVEGIFAGFFRAGHLVLDLVFAGRKLDGIISQFAHIKGTSILG